MSAFTRLKADFATNWTTILVGWNGLGALSPWPDRWKEFPPLLGADEIVNYAYERLSLSPVAEEDKIMIELLALNLQREPRETVKELLTRLSNLSQGDMLFELRKWRLILLEELLDHLPEDSTYALLALTEFWQNFGFPTDSPHEVQGRDNSISPSEYYQKENLQRLLNRHRTWIQEERATIKSRENIRE